MEKQTILVLGATGSTGRRVVGLLRTAGHPVRAASRRGEVRFDWADPATWEPAIGTASAMYLMAPDGTPVDPEFVATAVAQGVRHIVLLSSRAIEAMGDERLLAAERTVRESGAGWTILRPSWFAQNFDEGFFREAVMAGEIVLPVGGLRQAFVDAGDIAAVAAAALTGGDDHLGRCYEIMGPRALSFGEAVEVIARAAGREVRFRGTADAYLAQQRALGRSPEEVRAEIEAFASLRGCGDDEPDDLVERVTGRRPKDFETYAAEAAAAGAWRD